MSLEKRENKVKPASTKVMVNNPVTIAMEIGNGLKLPDYNNTENLTDDLILAPTEFMNRFKKFQGG